MEEKKEVRPLPVIKIIKDTFEAVWQNKEVYLRTLAIYVLISASIDVYWYLTEKADLWLLFIPSVFVGVWFALTCHRLILLGETSVPKFGLYVLSQRT